ncbi:MAG: asparagine synthase-related protein, partial [Ignavibacteria bacterium]
ATVFAQWCVFKKINESKIKVVLDGQGSDEILLGYFSFFPFYLKRLLSNPFNFITQYFKSLSTTGLGFINFTENFFYFNTPSVRYKHVRNNGRKVFKDEFIDSFNRREIFNQMVAASTLNANRLSNLWNISLPSLLRYEDKNSMAFSVEARLPFLDHRLVEFVFSIPYKYLIKNGWTKNVLRESMKNKIPEDIRMRKGKLAFTVPQMKWLNEITDYVIKNFSEDFHASKYIDIQKILKAISSRNYNDKVLFRAFALEKWFKVFEVN